MPEQMNVEIVHKLSEPEQVAKEKRRWEEVIEILEVVVLALAAIATAWSGYQAAKGDGQQSVLYSDASVDRGQANTAAALGQQRLAADAPCSAPGWRPERPTTHDSRRCWCAGLAPSIGRPL
jgi:hypothetical protein